MVCVGIDFGSKKAGTTVITSLNPNSQLIIQQSTKNQDADVFILRELESIQPNIIAIDAPLSIPPGIYGHGDQYFYRQCDKDLNAMSPMFLGGLTARAIALKHQLLKLIPDVKIYETYPKAYIQKVANQELRNWYKNQLDLFQREISNQLPEMVIPTLDNWHQVDGLLAYLSSERISRNMALKFGGDDGMIYV